MNITTIGLDLAKNVFQVHGVDQRGKAVLRKTLKRADVMIFFAKLLPCLIGMEACGSAHYWARKLAELGHTVKLMAPQFVKPYVKTNKNDARCRGDLRGGEPSQHEVRASKNGCTTGSAEPAQGATGICRRAHCTGESDSRIAQ